MIRPELMTAVRTETARALLAGANTQEWAGGAAWIGAQRATRFDVHARDRLLAGDPTPAWTPDLPESRRRGREPKAAVAPDGTFAVVAGESSVRALEPSGALRWEVAHDPWPTGGGPSEPPSFSRDGRHVSVVVPALEDSADGEQRILLSGSLGPGAGRGYVCDRWLLIDAATGGQVRREPIPGVDSDAVQRWPPDGLHLAISAWTPWVSWRTRWQRRDGTDGPAVALDRRIATIAPDGSRVYSLRDADGMTGPDDVNDLAVHTFPDGEELARLDGAHLGRHDDDQLQDAALVAPGHLIGAVGFAPGVVTAHWLLDATTLHVLGEISYPVDAGQVAALGDGTWLTVGDDALHRWRIPAAGRW